ncbi:helix-turn-helix domain-containing protein [Streptomyces sp. NPDC053513]|uniref:helix-turn-helix domain-containing protein n=1 Tax=unclassified Streptomyces TaxID=2593676 RepID=UPI0037CF99F6
MGRPESPLPDDAPGPARELAQALRDLKDAQRLSYRELSERASYSPASLSRALSGRTVPTWEAVEAFLRACHVPEPEFASVNRMWAAASKATRRPALAPMSLEAQALDLMVSGRLKELHVAAGAPTLRTISERSGIPMSTTHRALSPHSEHGTPSANVALRVADCLLDFLTSEERAGHFMDVEALVRSHRDEEGQLRTRPREGGVRRAVAAAAAAEESAAAALRELAARASRLQDRIASGELHADGEVVRLLADLRDQAATGAARERS